MAVDGQLHLPADTPSTRSTTPPDVEHGLSEAEKRLADRPEGLATGPSRGARADVDEPPLEAGSPARTPSRSPRARSIEKRPNSAFTSAYGLPETWSLLVFATIWGVLGRLGLEWIGGFAEREVFAVIWAQMVGCLIMGWVTERKKGLERIFPPLFVMCGTGFCGSMTTWSTMAHDTFTAFANLDQPIGTSRFSGFLSGVAVTLITLAASLTALDFGVHIHSFLPHLPSIRRPLPHNTAFNALVLSVGPLFLLGALFLLIFGPHSWRTRATFAIVLGPPGTLLRYQFSRWLNPLNPRLPLGTLAANSLAVLVYAVTALLARHPNSALSCAALKGLQDGFCGSLSTVSTLVLELRGLKRRDSYRYFVVTWCVSEVLLVLVLGSWVWSGDREGLCWV
ncbi:hypothetical protein JCM1841_001113 [Sporobolomyces salmonicolor]